MLPLFPCDRFNSRKRFQQAWIRRVVNSYKLITRCIRTRCAIHDSWINENGQEIFDVGKALARFCLRVVQGRKGLECTFCMSCMPCRLGV